MIYCDMGYSSRELILNACRSRKKEEEKRIRSSYAGNLYATREAKEIQCQEKGNVIKVGKRR